VAAAGLGLLMIWMRDEIPKTSERRINSVIEGIVGQEMKRAVDKRKVTLTDVGALLACIREEFNGRPAW